MAKKKGKASQPQRGEQGRISEGLAAFKGGNYNKAISVWEYCLKQSPVPGLKAALAEVYFRRGIQIRGDTSLLDLQRAVELMPGEGRYQYHLGLTYHCRGDLESAVVAYRKTGQLTGEFNRRLAYPLALALVEQGQDPAQEELWGKLPAEQRQMLEQAQSFGRRPYRALKESGPLWQGLVAYEDGRLDQAQSYLTEALDKPTGAGIASYYLGAIAARQEDWPETIKFWQAAWDAGFRTVHLQENLGELYHRMAEQALQDGDHETAVSYGGQAESLKPSDNALGELLSVGWQHYAQDTLANEDWESALDYWELAEEQGGGTFRLSYNMALALERLELYMEAAERWREALRRRPRRDDHPDAISDAQVARLWHRVALAYEKAGEYEEAIQVYKQAVKWQPDDFSVRMALAQRLLDMGRFQAAENELGRILEQNGDYIPALLLIGEVMADSQSWNEEAITVYWHRVLELDPDNLAARDNLANYYQDLGERYLSWGYQSELPAFFFEKALTFRPENGLLWARAARAYFVSNDRQKAQSYMDRAMELSPTDLRVYGELMVLFLAHNLPDQAWPILDKAEQAVAEIPTEFYISLAATCLLNNQPEQGQFLLDRAVKRAKADEPIFLEIGQFLALLKGAGEIARHYLRQAIDAGQDPAVAHMMLGIAAIKENEEEMAEQHWQTAEKLARETDNHELLPAIQQARMLYTGPFAFMARNLDLGNLSALEAVMSGDLFEDDDEYYDYLYDEDDFDYDDDDYFDDEEFLDSLFGEEG